MAFIARLKLRDADFVADVSKQFKEHLDKFVRKLQAHDRETFDEWREKIAQKVNLVVERRRVRAQLLIESREGEVIVEVRGEPAPKPKTKEQVMRKATDREAFADFMKPDMSDFEALSKDNIQELITAREDQDRVFRISLMAADMEFIDMLAKAKPELRDQLLADRDKKRQEAVIVAKQERKQQFKKLWDEYIALNDDILRHVDELSLDSVDEFGLAGVAFEDYCYDD
jgi:hypothetical protein